MMRSAAVDWLTNLTNCCGSGGRTVSNLGQRMLGVMSEVSAAAEAHAPDADALTADELAFLKLLATEPFDLSLTLKELMADAHQD